MAFSLSSVSRGKQIKAPRIVVLGTEGIGKTSFACGAEFEGEKMVSVGENAPILIPCKGEQGADSLGVPMTPVCKSKEDILEVIAELYGAKHDFRTTVIDSASALSPIIADGVCQEFGVNNIRKVPGFRTGEAAILNRWREMLDGLDALRDAKNMSSIIIGHVKVKKMKNPEGDDYDTYDFDLEFQDVADLLKRWADIILFCNRKVVVKVDGEDTKFSKAKKRGLDPTGGARFMYTQQRPAHPGKCRFGNLPYEMPLSWKAFQSAVAEVISNGVVQQQEEGAE